MSAVRGLSEFVVESFELIWSVATLGTGSVWVFVALSILFGIVSHFVGLRAGVRPY